MADFVENTKKAYEKKYGFAKVAGSHTGGSGTGFGSFGQEPAKAIVTGLTSIMFIVGVPLAAYYFLKTAMYPEESK